MSKTRSVDSRSRVYGAVAARAAADVLRFLFACSLALACPTAGAWAGAQEFIEVGDVGRIAIPLGSILYLAVAENIEAAGRCAAGVAATAAATEGLKAAIDARRPSGEGDDSNPSGHASAAFSGVACILSERGWKEALVPLALATAVGASRLVDDEEEHRGFPAHRPHEVLLGAALPFVVQYGVNSLYERTFGKNFSRTVSFAAMGSESLRSSPPDAEFSYRDWEGHAGVWYGLRITIKLN
ncbi:MAG TPA: hypothetical protein VFG47_03220 [Geminicoccaceae bacterium]|nr:hypothetical protein [Geminicoccaceae bacterium]